MPETKKLKTKATKKKAPSIIQSLKGLFVYPKFDYSKGSLVIFACDPGIKNFAYCLIEVPAIATTEDRLKDLEAFLDNVRIIECGLFKSCLSEIRQDNLLPYLDRFKKDNAKLFTKEIDHLVLERYQARDLRGPRNEVINFNICNVINNFLAAEYPVRNTRLFIAAQWKRYFNIDKVNKVKGLDLLYDNWKKDKQLRKLVTDHQTDAFLIGIYFALDNLLGAEKDKPQLREYLVTFLINNTANYFRKHYNIPYNVKK